ncbi:Hypothetical predicted protein, partial [Marmota monax]
MEAAEQAPLVALPQSPELSSCPGDISPCDLTILHFNDVYDVDPSPEEPVGGAARCGRHLPLSDSGGVKRDMWPSKPIKNAWKLAGLPWQRPSCVSFSSVLALANNGMVSKPA